MNNKMTLEDFTKEDLVDMIVDGQKEVNHLLADLTQARATMAMMGEALRIAEEDLNYLSDETDSVTRAPDMALAESRTWKIMGRLAREARQKIVKTLESNQGGEAWLLRERAKVWREAADEYERCLEPAVHKPKTIKRWKDRAETLESRAASLEAEAKGE